jgi:uncharacterized membrane protein
MNIPTNIIFEIINICGVTISTLIMRWLLGLSTIEKDIMWIKQTKLWKMCARLSFYRGTEYIHQIRGKHVYSSSNN